jgi:prepilin-type N-terminal cleavage/methylation domain-containing protein/prepilin-type processing-associated H-X9-DG protein
MHTIRRGFTLIELLVVIAVIGLLTAILLPALSSVRNSAAALQCKTNLKQIGVAISAYHASQSCFPLTMTDSPRNSTGICGTGLYSWMAQILPYVEQKILYDQINFEVDMADDCMLPGAISNTHPNATVAGVTIDLFMCPSDYWTAETKMGSANPGNNSYVANMGWPAESTGIHGERPVSSVTGTAPYNGLFSVAAIANNPNASVWHPTNAVTSRDVTDGLQYTAAVSERLISRESNPTLVKDERLMFFCGCVNERKPATQQQLSDGCYLVHVQDPTYSINMGQSWISGSSFVSNTYMHVLTPNKRSCYVPEGLRDGDWWTTPSSRHPGGVHILMGDGHVEWIDNGINNVIWWGMGSRDGQELARTQDS